MGALMEERPQAAMCAQNEQVVRRTNRHADFTRNDVLDELPQIRAAAAVLRLPIYLCSDLPRYGRKGGRGSTLSTYY